MRDERFVAPSGLVSTILHGGINAEADWGRFGRTRTRYIYTTGSHAALPQNVYYSMSSWHTASVAPS